MQRQVDPSFDCSINDPGNVQAIKVMRQRMVDDSSTLLPFRRRQSGPVR